MLTSRGGSHEVADDSVKKTISVALGVCIICSILVSSAAVALRGIQIENQRLDRIKNILIAGDLFTEGADIRALYEEKIEPRMIDLTTGETVLEENLDGTLNIDNFDIKRAAADPVYGKAVPADKDIAKISRMPRYMVVYLVKEDNKVDKIVLPVYGKGLWSTMYGFMALDKDLITVKGFTFYDHAETPGLGGEIDNPRWKNSWKEKQAFDEEGNVKIEVIKGLVDTSRPEAKYQIDGISGATLTARGVDHLVQFWLGDNGYGLFIKSLREDVHG
jgi:Na+-transporting NADH:ubiquinone oxidoreductase subunit C